MKQLLSIAAVFAVLACGALAFAQDGPKNKTKSIEDYAKMGNGVYNVKTNEDGEITSLIVVGTARVSTVLGASKGKDLARRKASMVCDSEFSKWCKTNLEVVETSEDEDIIVLKGSETDEDESLEEEGKSTEVMQRKITSYSKQTLRGMQILYSQLDAETKEFVVVKGLNMKRVEAVKKVSQALNNDDIEDADNVQKSYDDEDAPAKPEKKSRKGTLKSESHFSPEADEFL